VVFFDNEGDNKPKETEIEIYETTLTGYTEGTRKWIFRAESITSEGNTALAKRVTEGIIYKENEAFIDVKASIIQIDMISNNFTAKNGVKVDVMGKNQVFQSDNMSWYNNEEKIQIDGKITAYLEDTILTGHNLIYYVSEGKYQMEEGVKLEFDLEMP